MTDEEISHSLNEAHLGEAESIKVERKTLQERLEKLEQTREKVSDAVYQRVWNDYKEKLKQTMDRLIALKNGLEAEQKALAEKKALVEANLKHHRERIEEGGLRHTLGELTDDLHKELLEKEESEIKRLEKALGALGESFKRHETVFEGVVMPPPPPRAVDEKTHEKTSRIKLEGATEKVSQVPSPKVAELLILENGKVIQMIPLDHTIMIGRSPANDVVLKEPKVSRKHAEIHCAAGKYVLLDLESSNGTFVGGKKIIEQVLQPNDEISIGNTKMVFKT